ncbi:MAG: hypothetical protein ACLFV3_10125 [Phycisphaeraceae bacterium]
MRFGRISPAAEAGANQEQDARVGDEGEEGVSRTTANRPRQSGRHGSNSLVGVSPLRANMSRRSLSGPSSYREATQQAAGEKAGDFLLA